MKMEVTLPHAITLSKQSNNCYLKALPALKIIHYLFKPLYIDTFFYFAAVLSYKLLTNDCCLEIYLPLLWSGVRKALILH